VTRFPALLKRELKAIAREKTIMLAIIIQFFIASFSSMLLIGIMSFYDPESIGHNTRIPVDVGIIGNTGSPLVGFLKEQNLRVRSFTDLDNAEAAFRAGRIDTIILIPENNSGVVDIQMVLPEMDAMDTVILMVLKEPMEKFENYLREVNGVQLNYKDIAGTPNTTYEFLYTLIVPILMLFPAFIAGSIVVDAVAEEMENKTFDTLRSAPVSLNELFTSKISAGVIVSVAQCILWTLLLRLNNLVVHNIGLVLLLSAILAASISIGAAFITLYFKDRERAQFVYSMVLVVVAGLSYFLNPSPFALITRLAAADHYVGISQVALYLIPLAGLGALFLSLSKRLVSAKS